MAGGDGETAVVEAGDGRRGGGNGSSGGGGSGSSSDSSGKSATVGHRGRGTTSRFLAEGAICLFRTE